MTYWDGLKLNTHCSFKQTNCTREKKTATDTRCVLSKKPKMSLRYTASCSRHQFKWNCCFSFSTRESIGKYIYLTYDTMVYAKMSKWVFFKAPD